jgi:Heterokaryon incompatibility protein (HET)
MQVSTGQDRVETHLPHAENSMNTYQYRPLLPGHIRCLVIYPGTRESDVEVSLVHFSLQDDPSSILRFMEALSYTWGTPIPAKTIHCRNEPGKTLAVSPNLYDALVGLRQPDNSRGGGRIMWIDQLCL